MTDEQELERLRSARRAMGDLETDLTRFIDKLIAELSARLGERK